MSVTMTNGKPQRKQLSDQLDRLDSIIDVLADALPEAVRDAVRDGTREAVKDAVVEILTRPDLRALFTNQPSTEGITPPTTETAPPRVSLFARLKAKLAALKSALVERAQTTWTMVTMTVHLLRGLFPLGKILAIGSGVGLVVGVIAYVGPHSLAAIVSGLGAACTVVAVQVGAWLRRSAQFLGFPGVK